MRCSLAFLAGRHATAAIVTIRRPSVGVASVYVDAAELNGAFDTVIFEALTTPGGGSGFTTYVSLVNAGLVVYEATIPPTLDVPASFGPGPFKSVTSGFEAGVPRPAGQQLTYRNRMLDWIPTKSRAASAG